MISFIRLILGWFLMISCCGCFDDTRSRLHAAIAQGEHEIAPLIPALEHSRARHGRYPDQLADLVRDQFVSELPRFDCDHGAEYLGPLYDVDPDGAWFYLRFACRVGPSYWHSRYYVSDEARWTTTRYPPRMPQLVADRAGARYRTTGAADALALAVTNLLAAGSRGQLHQIDLSRATVEQALGSGSTNQISFDMGQDASTAARCYSATGEVALAYCFRYAMRPLEEFDIESNRIVEGLQYVAVEVLVGATPVKGEMRWRTCWGRQDHPLADSRADRVVPGK